GGLTLGLCGCSGFWDEVTSRDFEFQSMFVKPNPLLVLRDSTDGDQRAKAMRALHEPAQHGGTAQEQELVIQILTTAAKTDKQPLCRLAAIQSLGECKDPRAAPALMDAFYSAKVFAPDTATIIQCQALTALGNTHDPAGVELLARVTKEPPPAEDVTEHEKQQSLDIRIAAARALGNFKDNKAEEALVYVLKTE